MAGERHIDEAYRWLSELVVASCDLAAAVGDDAAGIRMEIVGLGIDTPVELDVRVHDDGSVELGCAPPFYPVEITTGPVLHRLRFDAVAEPPGAPPGSARHG